MENTKTVAQNVIHVVSVTCDCCGKGYFDMMDIQEFLRIDEVGGYNSTIGDCVRYRLDMCGVCIKKILGKYLRIDEELCL